MNKSVIILNMSTIYRTTYTCYKRFNKKAQTDYYYFGVSQLEAGTKMILMNLAQRGIVADKIIVTATPEARNEINGTTAEKYKVKNNGEIIADSAVEFYKKRITDYIHGHEENSRYEPGNASTPRYDDPDLISAQQKKDYEALCRLYEEITDDFFADNIVKVIPLGTGHNTEFADIVNVMQASEENKIDLYIDLQGGQRSFVYVLNATLDMLPGLINIKGRYSVNFGPQNATNEIISEDKSYRVMELAAALKSFNQYGKADLLEAYFKDELHRPAEKKMIGILKTIADSLSICSPDDFYNALGQLKSFYDNHEDQECSDPQFMVVVDEIRKQFDTLISPDRTVLDCVKWSLQHDFIQQALTLIESLIPTELEQKGIVTYGGNDSVPVLRKNHAGWQETGHSMMIDSAINLSKEQAKKEWEKNVNYLFFKWAARNTPANSNQLDLSMQKDQYYQIPVAGNYQLNGNNRTYIYFNDSNYRCSISCGMTIKSSILHNQDKRRMFNQFLQLFLTLKKQRNTANHAVTDDRYNAANIRTAIEVFIEMAERIYMI